MKDLSKIKVLTKQENNQIASLAKTDPAAREKLVTGNLRYVMATAKSFYGQGLSMEDLIAEGNIGLMRAVNAFKPEKDPDFIKCAGWWIRHAMMMALSNNKIIHKPMNRIQEYKEIHGVYEKERLKQLDAPLGDGHDDNMTLADVVPGENTAVIDDDREQFTFLIKEGMKGLPIRSQKILLAFYGIGKEFPMPVENIAEEFAMSVANVHKIHRDVITHIRERLKRKRLFL